MKKPSKKLKEKDRDLWYKKMGNIPPPKPENEPFSWMEYFDLMDYYNENKIEPT